MKILEFSIKYMKQFGNGSFCKRNIKIPKYNTPVIKYPMKIQKRSLRSEKDVVQKKKKRMFVGPEVMGKGIKENSKSRGF